AGRLHPRPQSRGVSGTILAGAEVITTHVASFNFHGLNCNHLVGGYPDCCRGSSRIRSESDCASGRPIAISTGSWQFNSLHAWLCGHLPVRCCPHPGTIRVFKSGGARLYCRLSSDYLCSRDCVGTNGLIPIRQKQNGHFIISLACTFSAGL